MLDKERDIEPGKENVRFSDEEFALVKNLMLVYEWGQKAFMADLNILNEDFKNFHSNNPIEHIKARMKSPESIAEKLHRMNLDRTAANAKEYIKDIAGIRIICDYARDIYYLADILKSLPDVKTLSEEDYVSNPKPSGYRSFHLSLEIPIYYSGRTEGIPIEVQIRTSAMDFWATLEHKVRYKYRGQVPRHICEELAACSEKTDELDKRMYLINEIISEQVL